MPLGALLELIVSRFSRAPYMLTRFMRFNQGSMSKFNQPVQQESSCQRTHLAACHVAWRHARRRPGRSGACRDADRLHMLSKTHATMASGHSYTCAKLVDFICTHRMLREFIRWCTTFAGVSSAPVVLSICPKWSLPEWSLPIQFAPSGVCPSAIS